ncbi:SMP-30/gluconolactonase/LRE family protein [Shewanella acanthi]|uniref:SMP-30/gluconolactonase/LRE family protein n=1 Tax=Shewanella acanthi TaxID=2864212 RepID=UPI001C661AEB|nr:SMP-30/gluconolactonase/LRE family protein [Shewanella acanthi]QYJ78339.1 SMP-30/gluconolactonase/LRE family protein [Shewanella acanthi]
MLIDTINVGNDLGENILWDDKHNCLWWTDITQSKLHHYSWGTKELNSYSTPYKLCSFGFVEGQEQLLIAAFEHMIALYNPYTGQIDEIYQLDESSGDVRFNDGRVDAEGRFWVGTMSRATPPEKNGVVYCIAKSGDGYIVSEKVHHIKISNGLCWDAPNNRMFLADSAEQKIYYYDFLTTQGEVSNQRIFTQTNSNQYPDGAVTDQQGNLWSAHWGGYCVNAYSPNGELLETITLPVAQPTCVCFGGPELEHLFVSTARYGLNQHTLTKQPLAGDVFVFKLNQAGNPAQRFFL